MHMMGGTEGELSREIERQFSGDHTNNLTRFSYLGAGAELFQALIKNPNYKGYEREIGLVREMAPNLVGISGNGLHVIDFGPGDGVKSRLLIDQIRGILSYTGIEISREMAGLNGNLDCEIGDFNDVDFMYEIYNGTWDSDLLILILGNTIANEPDISKFLESLEIQLSNSAPIKTYILVGLELFSGDNATEIVDEYDNPENRALTVQPLKTAGIDISKSEVEIALYDIREKIARVEEWLTLKDGRKVLLSSTVKPTKEQWQEIVAGSAWKEIARVSSGPQILSLLELQD